MILTIIDKIPLYSTVREAVSWGRRNNLQNYHTHTHNGRLGYMAGANHSIFVNTPPVTTSPNIVTPRTPVVARNTNVNTNTNTNTNTGGGGY
tara:strand:- start:37 stop:312 length:276 start_codon:yes stop_codon:yes gene_type:complete